MKLSNHYYIDSRGRIRNKRENRRQWPKITIEKSDKDRILFSQSTLITIDLGFIWIVYDSTGMLWFRFRPWDWGLSIRNDKKDTYRPFSERYGYTRRLKVGRYSFKVLKP